MLRSKGRDCQGNDEVGYCQSNLVVKEVQQ